MLDTELARAVPIVVIHVDVVTNMNCVCVDREGTTKEGVEKGHYFLL